MQVRPVALPATQPELPKCNHSRFPVMTSPPPPPSLACVAGPTAGTGNTLHAAPVEGPVRHEAAAAAAAGRLQALDIAPPAPTLGLGPQEVNPPFPPLLRPLLETPPLSQSPWWLRRPLRHLARALWFLFGAHTITLIDMGPVRGPG